MERIRDILAGEKNDDQSGKPVPPSLARVRGLVEVWSRMHIEDGIELHIEPGRAGMSPEQVRELFRGVIRLYQNIKKGERENA